MERILCREAIFLAVIKHCCPVVIAGRQGAAQGDGNALAAETLLEMSGAQAFMQKVKHSANNALRSQGFVSDAYEAEAKTRTDGASVFTYGQSLQDAGGHTVDAPEMNLTWTLLGGGEFSGTYPKEMKELMMTLVGTTIYLKTGEGKDTVAQSRYIEGADIIHWNNGLWDVMRLHGDEPLTPIDMYTAMLERIYKKIRFFFPNAKIIFALSTSVIEENAPNGYVRYNSEIEEYNEAASYLKEYQDIFAH